MGRGKAGEQDVRILTKSGLISYSVTLPVDGVRKLRWQDGQRLVVELDSKKHQFVIRDWKNK